MSDQYNGSPGHDPVLSPTIEIPGSMISAIAEFLPLEIAVLYKQKLAIHKGRDRKSTRLNSSH
jgi:hypothetical protein